MFSAWSILTLFFIVTIAERTHSSGRSSQLYCHATQSNPEEYSDMYLSVSVLSIAIVSVLIIKLISHLQNYAKKWLHFRDITPMEKCLPLFGHALTLQGDSCQFYLALLRIVKSAQQTGREIGCLWLGTHPLIMLTGPNAAEVLLRSSAHTDKASLYDYLHPWLGTGLLTSKGEKWKTRRRLLTPAFHFNILNEFLSSMNEQSKIFSDKLEKHAHSGQAFDISSNITLCALDIICQTAMGEKLGAQTNSESDYVKAIYRVSDIIQERQKSPWLWSDIVFYGIPKGREFKRLINVLHGFTNTVIAERKKSFTKSPGKSGLGERKIKRAFLDLLLEAANDGERLSTEDIREEVDTFMFEGHDTTAAGMAWAVHLIGCHPSVQQRIHDELDSIFPDGMDCSEISPDDLRKMDYLERVIKESLRIFPSVPLMARTTTTACRIEGVDIPCGTECLAFNQVINNHPKYWENPESFDPDRFTIERSVGRHAYAYVPFSAGPRNCIGQKFAMMEEKVILAYLFRKFRVKSCDETADISQMSDLILRPGQGVNVTLEIR